MGDNPFRNLPAVNDILDSDSGLELLQEHPRKMVVDGVRLVLDGLRQEIRKGQTPIEEVSIELVSQRVNTHLQRLRAPLIRPVINATGIVLHTNLGRAPMAPAAAEAAGRASGGYLNLELDLETGKRSSRQYPIKTWIQRLTGAEAATVVNNNAAATIIALRAICHGKEVILSRGQLIEIGGSFRIPEIMSVSGAILKEIGTTNITRIRDYEQAITDNTGALLQIHTSNFRVRGFTKSASLEELVALGKKHNIPVIDDAGSGAFVDFNQFGLEGEPVIGKSLEAGVDLVLFSGDKLLGGPQAGILAGKKQWIDKIEKDPLMRAFRLDKMTLAALEATLQFYCDEAIALENIPILRMLRLTTEELRERALNFAKAVEDFEELASTELIDTVAYVGGGSLPDQALPTVVVAIQPKHNGVESLAKRLRLGTPAVMARIQNDALLFDLRTVFPEQEAFLLQALRNALKNTNC